VRVEAVRLVKRNTRRRWPSLSMFTVVLATTVTSPPASGSFPRGCVEEDELAQ